MVRDESFPPSGGSLIGEIVLWSESPDVPELPAIVVSESRKPGSGDSWIARMFVFGPHDGPFGMVTGVWSDERASRTWRFRGNGAPHPITPRQVEMVIECERVSK